MPRPRRAGSTGSSSSSLSSGQAAYVLERLIRERRVSQNEINRYVEEMHSEISTLEERLNRLRDAAGIGAAAAAVGGAVGAAAVAAAMRGRKPGRPGRPPGRPPGRRPGRPRKAASPGAATTGTGATASAPAAGGAAKGGRKRRRSAITPEQLASRQLQGRYLALVRRFPESKRAQYARLAKEKGREAAIKDMQDALK